MKQRPGHELAPPGVSGRAKPARGGKQEKRVRAEWHSAKALSRLILKRLSWATASEIELNLSGAEKGAKGFDCWEPFVAMMFRQLAQAKSLREIASGSRSCEGKLRHLGLSETPGRSTLPTSVQACTREPVRAQACASAWRNKRRPSPSGRIASCRVARAMTWQ